MFAVAPSSAHWRAASLFALCLGLACALPAAAQDAPPPAEPPADSSAAAQPAPAAAPQSAPAPAKAASTMPGLAAAAAADPDAALALPVLFEPRPASAINGEIELMNQLSRESLERYTDFKQRQANKSGQIEAKKIEITNTRAQLDLARKAKRADEQKTLEKQRKQLELQQRFLERLRDLYAARVESEEATSAYAQARVGECKAELRLNNLGELTSTAVRTSAATRMALNDMFDALKLRAERMTTAAGKEQALVAKRQAVLTAYDDMFR